MKTRSSEEFDCIECGRHIVRLPADSGYPRLCAECLHIPGWFNNDELRNMLDPGMETPNAKE